MEQVKVIRARYAKGKVLQRELAEEYGVDQTQVSHIIRRTQWVSKSTVAGRNGSRIRDSKAKK